MSRSDVAGEIAVQMWECELIRERMSRQPSAYLQQQLREAIALGRRKWSRP